jgi:hypothetical protein
MAGIREWEEGQRASIMVGERRRGVVIERIIDAKVSVRFANGEKTRVYLNALLAPGQQAHFRSIEVEDVSNVARAANTLAADGYGTNTAFIQTPEGSVRVVAARIVPSEDAVEAQPDEGSETRDEPAQTENP